MQMFWKVRRRPSKFVMIVRSFLMVGAAVGVPVGLEVIRRMVWSGRSGGATHGANGRGLAAHTTAAASRRGSRRRRPATTMERT
jgi:hypothetical protein